MQNFYHTVQHAINTKLTASQQIRDITLCIPQNWSPIRDHPHTQLPREDHLKLLGCPATEKYKLKRTTSPYYMPKATIWAAN